MYLNGSPISITSKIQRIVTLSVTESEYVEMTECMQNMLFAMPVLNDMELKVKLPMLLDIDNGGAVDISNSWSSTGQMRHMDLRLKFLRELKDANILHVRWISGTNNELDMFTKNVGGTLYEKHLKQFVGTDKYMSGVSQEESVGRKDKKGVVSPPTVGKNSPVLGADWVGAESTNQKQPYVADCADPATRANMPTMAMGPMAVGMSHSITGAYGGHGEDANSEPKGPTAGLGKSRNAYGGYGDHEPRDYDG